MKHPAPVLAALLLGGVLALQAGCDALTQEARFWVCDPYDPDPHPDNPCPFPPDAGPGPGSCSGQCVPIGPLDWTPTPFLLWIGNEFEAPQCPDRALKVGYEGHADLIAPVECGECSCLAPSCELPVGLTANSTTCPPDDDPGTLYTPFNAPPNWDGSCVAPPAIPANLLGSVTIAPLTVSPCVAETGPIPHKGQLSWKTFARACLGEAMGTCASSGEVCSPTAEPPPPGFSQCIKYLMPGDAACPADYPVKHVFYGDFTDTRDCTQCSCSPPIGSDCSAYLSLYTDADCTTDLMGNVLQTANAAICLDVAAGNQLQSLSATPVDNQPGYCQASGGVPYGEATPMNPSTFCCQE